MKILIHLMIDHPDWFQWKSVLPQVKEAKKVVQQALKPGGGGPDSSRVGKLVLNLSYQKTGYLSCSIFIDLGLNSEIFHILYTKIISPMLKIGYFYLIFTGIAYDFPDSNGYGGNTTTSEACRKFYRSSELRSRLVNLCPNLYKNAFEQILFNDLIILRLISCRYRLLVDKIGGFVNCKN